MLSILLAFIATAIICVVSLLAISFAILLSLMASDYLYAMILVSLCLVGRSLNIGVKKANGGTMPVFMKTSLSKRLYGSGSRLGAKHHVGTSDTKLKFLTDIIDIGIFVCSIGDVLIFAAAAVSITYLYSLI